MTYDVPVRKISVKVVSDGTVENTHLVDADTGERLAFDATYTWHLLFNAKTGGKAKVALVLDDVPVIPINGVTEAFELRSAYPKKEANVNA